MSDSLTRDRHAAIALHVALTDAIDLLEKIQRADTLKASEFRARLGALRIAHSVGNQLLHNERAKS